MRVLNDVGRLNGVVEITSSETTFGLAFTALTGTMAVVDLPAIRRDAKNEEYGVGGKPVMLGQDSAGVRLWGY